MRNAHGFEVLRNDVCLWELVTFPTPSLTNIAPDLCQPGIMTKPNQNWPLNLITNHVHQQIGGPKHSICSPNLTHGKICSKAAKPDSRFPVIVASIGRNLCIYWHITKSVSDDSLIPTVPVPFPSDFFPPFFLMTAYHDGQQTEGQNGKTWSLLALMDILKWFQTAFLMASLFAFVRILVAE